MRRGEIIAWPIHGSGVWTAKAEWPEGQLIKALCFYFEKFRHYPSRDYGE